MKFRFSQILSITTLILVSVSGCNLPEINPVEAGGKWQVQLGSNLSDEGLAVLVNDTTVFVLGRERNVSNVSELVVYKLGKKGQVLAKQILTVVGEAYGGNMAWGPNNEIFVLSQQPGYRFGVTRLASATLSVGQSKSYYGIDPKELVVTSNGEVVVAGHRLSSSFSGSGILILSWEARLARLSANLDSLWSRAYFAADQGVFTTVLQTPSFELVTAGSVIESGGSNRNGLLVRTSSSGVQMGSGQLGKAGVSERISSVIREASGQYVAGGYVVSSGAYDPFFARTAANFASLTESNGFPQLAATNELIYKVIPTVDGGFAATGYIWKDGVEADMLLLKVDNGFNYQWHQTYGGPFRDYAYDIKQMPDGGFVIVGFTAVNESNYDIKVIRTDAQGEVD